MKEKIFNFLKKKFPKWLKWLKGKEADKKASDRLQKAGKAARETEEAIVLLKEISKDGKLDQDELLKSAKELSEAFVAWCNLFGLTEITITNKKKS